MHAKLSVQYVSFDEYHTTRSVSPIAWFVVWFYWSSRICWKENHRLSLVIGWIEIHLNSFVPSRACIILSHSFCCRLLCSRQSFRVSLSCWASFCFCRSSSDPPTTCSWNHWSLLQIASFPLEAPSEKEDNLLSWFCWARLTRIVRPHKSLMSMLNMHSAAVQRITNEIVRMFQQRCQQSPCHTIISIYVPSSGSSNSTKANPRVLPIL